MYRLILVFSVCVLLAGCQAQMTFDRLDPVDKQALIDTKSADCKAFGFKPGTTAYAQCIQAAILERDRAISQRQAATIAASRPRYCANIADPYAFC
ncbi:hypothetical protein [Hoeflea sp. TYP-13]|uniref:hypothetical protein n=1 Tax=Hoeflea sp. TYP-13 TaxID=3230023 RepID=UPI0034C624BC